MVRQTVCPPVGGASRYVVGCIQPASKTVLTGTAVVIAVTVVAVVVVVAVVAIVVVIAEKVARCLE
jgi:hypothetical protein